MFGVVDDKFVVLPAGEKEVASGVVADGVDASIVVFEVGAK